MAHIHALYIVLLQCVLALCVAAAEKRLPRPTGPFSVGTNVLPLTDESRAETHGTGQRKVLLSLYFPTNSSAEFSPYLPGPTQELFETAYSLPNGSLALGTNSHLTTDIHPDCAKAGVNTIVFSPGLGASRLVYTALLEDLASHGYLVVSIDHPYDAAIVVFPDGEIILSAVPANHTTADLLPWYETRVADAIFVAKSLPELPILQGRVRIGSTGVFGHSFGGATAAGAILEAPARFVGGINQDGEFFGRAVNSSVNHAFLLMGSGNHSSQVGQDPTWSEFRAAQEGWVRELHFANSMHLTYSDLAPLVDILGLRSVFPPDTLDPLVGTVDGLRAEEIVRVYTRAFFDWILRSKPSTLLDRASKAYPEISFVE